MPNRIGTHINVPIPSLHSSPLLLQGTVSGIALGGVAVSLLSFVSQLRSAAGGSDAATPTPADVAPAAFTYFAAAAAIVAMCMAGCAALERLPFARYYLRMRAGGAEDGSSCEAGSDDDCSSGDGLQEPLLAAAASGRQRAVRSASQWLQDVEGGLLALPSLNHPTPGSSKISGQLRLPSLSLEDAAALSELLGGRLAQSPSAPAAPGPAAPSSGTAALVLRPASALSAAPVALPAASGAATPAAKGLRGFADLLLPAGAGGSLAAGAGAAPVAGLRRIASSSLGAADGSAPGAAGGSSSSAPSCSASSAYHSAPSSTYHSAPSSAFHSVSSTPRGSTIGSVYESAQSSPHKAAAQAQPVVSCPTAAAGIPSCSGGFGAIADDSSKQNGAPGPLSRLDWTVASKSAAAELADSSQLSASHPFMRYCGAIFASFAVTLSVFPGVTAFVCSVNNPATVAPCAASAPAGRLFGDLFVPATYLLFNAADFAGRAMAGIGPWARRAPAPWQLGVYCGARAVIAITLLFAHVVTPAQWALPELLGGTDAAAWGLVVALGLSNGHMMATACMHAPALLPAARQAVYGPAVSLACTAGCFLGSLVSLAAVALLQRPLP